MRGWINWKCKFEIFYIFVKYILQRDSNMKVAVVTGGNKGIGYAIVQGLCKQLQNYDVILTGIFFSNFLYIVHISVGHN